MPAKFAARLADTGAALLIKRGNTPKVGLLPLVPRSL